MQLMKNNTKEINEVLFEIATGYKHIDHVPSKKASEKMINEILSKSDDMVISAQKSIKFKLA